MNRRPRSPRALAVALLLALAVVAAWAVWRASSPPAGGGPGRPAHGPAARPPVLAPHVVDAALAPVREEVAREATPGAAVAVGVRDREVHLAGLGKVGWTANAPAVDPRTTLYDLASLTKVLATASAVMLLVDDGRLGLDDPVSRYLPEFTGEGRDKVTIRHLASHTSGLPPTGRARGTTRARRIASLLRTPIYFQPGTAREYSDAGYVILWQAAERAAGEPLPRYLQRRLYEPLGMTHTRFSPGLECEACAPTSRLRSQELYRGKPFDPMAQRLDGISGNAGLFSTAADVARFAAMITAGGALHGVRVLREETVREFTRLPVGEPAAMLGWETFCGDEESHGCERPVAFGHTGWTGTSLWIDPGSGRWAVLLTNRTYETRAESRLHDVRRELFARVTE